MADITIPIENLSAYIYRSLRNRVIDLLRSRKDEVTLDAAMSGNSISTLADSFHDLR